MKLWLMLQKFTALNTMYRKTPEKQTTYRSPKCNEKQLDYILIKRRHLKYSKDAEANDMIHMGCDHRCVMATFTIIALGKSSHYKTEKTLKLRSLSSKKHTKRSLKKKRRQKKQQLKQKAKMQKHKPNIEAEAKNTETEAEEVEEACTGIMVNDGVETTGKAGEGHSGLHTVDEEAGHIVLRVEHVEHDTNDDMGERTMTNTTNATGEQTESVIETEHLGGELLAQLSRSDEEAGSIVSHVSSDMNEKEKDDEEAGKTAAAKETEEISKEDIEIRRLIEDRRSTPKEEKQRLKEVSKCIKKCIRDKKRMKRQQNIQRIREDFN